MIACLSEKVAQIYLELKIDDCDNLTANIVTIRKRLKCLTASWLYDSDAPKVRRFKNEPSQDIGGTESKQLSGAAS